MYIITNERPKGLVPMHGAESPQTQKVMYGRLGNLEQKKRWAKKLVGIE
jgi:hypothetical protein